MNISRSSNPEKYLQIMKNEDGSNRIYFMCKKLAKKNTHPFKANDKIIIHKYFQDPKRPKNFIALCSYPDGVYLFEVPDFQIEKPKVGRASLAPEQKEQSALSGLNQNIEFLKQEHGLDYVRYAQYHDDGQISLHRISHAEKVPGTPKADFLLFDLDGNHVFVSHKAGTKLRDFQQFGGASEERSHSSVRSAALFIKHHYDGDMSKAPGTVSVKLHRYVDEDDDMINRAVWGKEYGKIRATEAKNFRELEFQTMPFPHLQTAHKREYGINNVHMLCQGDLSLKSELLIDSEGYYVMDASGSVHTQGNLPQGNWQLAVSYRHGRIFTAELEDGSRLTVGGRAMIMLEASRKAAVHVPRPVELMPNYNYTANHQLPSEEE